MISELLASTLFSIHVESNGRLLNLQDAIYSKIFFSILTPAFGSLVYSLLYVLICMVPVAILYRKKIIVKI
jgi:predicted acyltransferase